MGTVIHIDENGAAAPDTGTESIVQTLNDGQNSVVHGLGKVVTSVDVWNGDIYADVDYDIVDSNEINIALAGGGPLVDARIEITYLN